MKFCTVGPIKSSNYFTVSTYSIFFVWKQHRVEIQQEIQEGGFDSVLTSSIATLSIICLR